MALFLPLDICVINTQVQTTELATKCKNACSYKIVEMYETAQP